MFIGEKMIRKIDKFNLSLIFILTKKFRIDFYRK